MSIFNELQNSGNPQMPNMADIQKYAWQLQGNPVGFLQNLGFNIPAGIDIRNPNAIIGHLMQSNQVNSGLLGKAQHLMALLKS